MNLNLTLVGQAISFAIFVTFCMKYVWPPLQTAMRERQEKIAQGLADAEKAQQKREDAEAEVAKMIEDARAQAADIVAQAQKRGNEIVEESRTSAKAESERIRQQAESEIEQKVVSARESLREQVGSLAMEAARRILGREVDASAHQKVVDDLVREI